MTFIVYQFQHHSHCHSSGMTSWKYSSKAWSPVVEDEILSVSNTSSSRIAPVSKMNHVLSSTNSCNNLSSNQGRTWNYFILFTDFQWCYQWFIPRSDSAIDILWSPIYNTLWFVQDFDIYKAQNWHCDLTTVISELSILCIYLCQEHLPMI